MNTKKDVNIHLTAVILWALSAGCTIINMVVTPELTTKWTMLR